MYSVTVSLPSESSASRSPNGTTTSTLTLLRGDMKCARIRDLPSGP